MEPSLRIDYRDSQAADRIVRELLVLTTEAQDRRIVLLCIGTDRSIGDSLGPQVGTLLQESGLTLPVYGTLEEPVGSHNLEDTIERINQVHRHPLVIAIDACLGRAESIGKLLLGPGPIQPGNALKKTLPPVGDISLTGIVNVGGFMEYFVLQNTPLSRVMGMARVIAQGVALWAAEVGSQQYGDVAATTDAV